MIDKELLLIILVILVYSIYLWIKNLTDKRIKKLTRRLNVDEIWRSKF
tara:strand:+ start:3304 stop:3447 length:144 start_codon:yes stop_codon:yes gene_type:complete